MVKNYYTMAFRSVKKNRINTAINVFGIAIGMAAALLIVQYTSLEFSFDEFHAKKDQIFRVDRTVIRNGEEARRRHTTTYQLAPTIADQVPGVERYTRVHPVGDGAVVTYWSKDQSQKQFFEEEQSMLFVDQAFFEMFDFELLQGSRGALLSSSRSIVITEEVRQRYFPDNDNPLGEILKIDGSRQPGSYKVSGILEVLPENTRFKKAQFFLPMQDLLKAEQYKEGGGWNWSNFVSYIQLEQNADISQVRSEAINIINERNEQAEEEADAVSNVVLSALPDLHLRDQTGTAGLTDERLQFFLLVAFFIVAVAWLNYINLSTAQAMQRAKEVGIRKVIGAFRSQLLQQFMFEALIVNVFGLLLAFALAYGSLPLLEDITGKSYVFGQGIPMDVWILLVGVFLVGTFLSGFYPAIILSRFNIAVVIKGVTSTRNRKFGLRQVLVTFQLVIAVFLISGTWTVYRQLNFMQNQDLGFEMEKVLTVKGPFVFEDAEENRKRLDLFRSELLEISGIEQVSISRALPGGDYNWGSELASEETPEEEHSILMMMVDEHFQDAYSMELLAGRFHQKELQAVPHQIVVNETLVKQFNLGTPEEAVGKRLKNENLYFPIIGVLKDYHWYSLKEEKVPTFLYYDGAGVHFSIKMSAADVGASLIRIQERYNDLFPGNPFEYRFVDDYFNEQYESDRRFRQIFSSFSSIAVIIACLGLFGLASFTVSLRVKEIGIRKVLGAKVFSILVMLFKDYLLLVVLASIIGVPILYVAIDRWLKDFAYRINITPDLFLVPLLLLIMIMIFTIGYQSITAARRNPVDSLRSE